MRISDWSSDVCSSDLGRLSMPLLRRLAGVAVALACLWSAAAPAAETVRVGVLKYGTVNWEISILQRNEMDVQHGFHHEVLDTASDPATAVPLHAGTVLHHGTGRAWFLPQTRESPRHYSATLTT